MTAPSPDAAAPGEETVLDHLVGALRSRDLALDGQARPAAILWTDPEREWGEVLPLLGSAMEELLVLGDYSPEDRTGPAIWLRCMVDRTLDELELPGNRPPVLYLAGVGRQDLRAGEDCRAELRPLVELMFRGSMWLQSNGSDWTVRSFLTSKRSLDLDVAGDQATAAALRRALPEVARRSVASLRKGRLEAEDLDRMLSGDLARDILRWLGDPEATRASMEPGRWEAFASRARAELGLDPRTDADVEGGALLGRKAEGWERVWNRFEETPGAYPGIPDLLRRSAPDGIAYFPRESWPQVNEMQEDAVRKALAALPDLGHEEARSRVLELEREHGDRRDWVWARLGLAPLAGVLGSLAELAKAVEAPLAGPSTEALRDAYTRGGWKADVASWEALAGVPVADEDLVAGVVRHLLGPWLDESARSFQARVEVDGLPGPGDQGWVEVPESGCVFFVDGLRYDLAERLTSRLEARGLRVELKSRWAALPSVTATGKPAVAPVADSVRGEGLGADFAPVLDGETDSRPADAAALRAALEARGFQLLDARTPTAPCCEGARGWLESGDIDSLGHKVKGRLPRHLGEELDRIDEAVARIVAAGWAPVRIVTDHGWLFLPGGLPKIPLPKVLTESRWARCAVLSGESSTTMPRVPWSWNPTESFATAPGSACFRDGEVYAHGGLSLQECLTPDLAVTPGVTAAEASARIEGVTWRGMRCFLEVEAAGPVTADLRLGGAAGPSVAVDPKPVLDGTARLLLAGDEHEHADLTLVLLDPAGTILAHRATRVGEES